MNTRGFAFEKPKDKKPVPRIVISIMDDGRELIAPNAAGRREYRKRVERALCLQQGLCFWCQQPLSLTEATFDHIKPRGMGGGFRDDRQSNCAAVHLRCNHEKGSRRVA